MGEQHHGFEPVQFGLVHPLVGLLSLLQGMGEDLQRPVARRSESHSLAHSPRVPV